MRLANTTFVNLRSALDDLKPLVDASKPVAPKLQKLLLELRPLAQDAVPTVHNLANIICTPQHQAVGCSYPGPNQDLIDLTRQSIPLAAVTVHNVQANGKSRPGAFPESVTSLNSSTPELAVARPYAVDLTGWFEGYTHPGGDDANGGVSRVAPVVSIGSISSGVLNILPSILTNPLGQFLQAFGAGTPKSGGVLVFGQGDRCPGSMERGGLFYPQSGFPCNPSQVPTGP
jgi:phospholipid/cholesterol/gamma-HCH transport system substrate-binding protein